MSRPGTSRSHEALLEAIRAFKAPEDSDLEAALNAITNHAATIRALRDREHRIKGLLSALVAELQSVVAELGSEVRS